MKPLFRNIAIALFLLPVVCAIMLGVIMIQRLDTPAFLSNPAPSWMQMIGRMAFYGMQVGVVIGWPAAVYLLIKGKRSKG